jgi:hypothetical protein
MTMLGSREKPHFAVKCVYFRLDTLREAISINQTGHSNIHHHSPVVSSHHVGMTALQSSPCFNMRLFVGHPSSLARGCAITIREKSPPTHCNSQNSLHVESTSDWVSMNKLRQTRRIDSGDDRSLDCDIPNSTTL